MIDLQKFCGNEWYRPYLHKPFTRDGFTWATNGHVIVRVDPVDGVEPLSDKQPLNVGATVAGLEMANFFTPSFDLPPAQEPTMVECAWCEGRGTVHDCPDCGCICEDCDGKKMVQSEPTSSTTIGGVYFTLRYVHLICSLPGLQIAHTAIAKGPALKPLLFRFDGGVGALMPRTSKSDPHIEIERAAA